jgi:hypothetical protein
MLELERALRPEGAAADVGLAAGGTLVELARRELERLEGARAPQGGDVVALTLPSGQRLSLTVDELRAAYFRAAGRTVVRGVGALLERLRPALLRRKGTRWDP